MSDIEKLSHETTNYLSIIYSELQTIENRHPNLNHDSDWRNVKEDILQLSSIIRSFSSGKFSLQDSSKTAAAIAPELSSCSHLPSSHFQQFQSKMEPFSVHHLLQSLIHSWKLYYSKKGLHLTYINQSKKMQTMRGTPFEIIQIFNNLLSNSYDSLLKKQDNPFCEASWSPEAVILLSNYQNQIQIIVSDNGCGIPTKKLPYIFKEGFTSKKNGHGLGLAIVKDLVKKHHGHIVAHSKEQQGCEFHLYFPTSASDFR